MKKTEAVVPPSATDVLKLAVRSSEADKIAAQARSVGGEFTQEGLDGVEAHDRAALVYAWCGAVPAGLGALAAEILVRQPAVAATLIFATAGFAVNSIRHRLKGARAIAVAEFDSHVDRIHGPVDPWAGRAPITPPGQE